jgi:hypothetical protein
MQIKHIYPFYNNGTAPKRETVDYQRFAGLLSKKAYLIWLDYQLVIGFDKFIKP